MSIIHLIPFDIKYDNTEVIRKYNAAKFSLVKLPTPSYFRDFGQICHSVNLILGQTGQIFWQIDILPCRHPSSTYNSTISWMLRGNQDAIWMVRNNEDISFKGALDNFSLIPRFFFEKFENFIPLEVCSYEVNACLILLATSTWLQRYVNFFLQRPFLKVYF